MKGDSNYEIKKGKCTASKSTGNCISETRSNVSKQCLLLYLSSTQDAGSIENDEECKIMEWLSEKFTKYVIKAGAVPEELYAIYQYGFQIGLEMFCCFITCLIMAIYLHMILEFIVFTTVFMLLRTYAGGIHLNSFWSCYLCSVVIQTAVLIISSIYLLPTSLAWIFIVTSSALILKYTPVETINKELDNNEKLHCRKITKRIMATIILFTGGCTLSGIHEMASFIAWILVMVWISQYIGLIKFKIEKNKDKRG